MKVLKILGIIVLVILVIGLGIVLFGPSDAHVERQLVIDAEPEVILSEVSNMKTYNTWSPWFELDKNAKYEWEGPASGVGAKMIWYSDDQNVGNGSMEVVEANETMVKYLMVFDEDGDGDLSNNQENPAFASMILTEVDGGTQVNWTFDAENMTGFGKFFALMMDSFLGPMYEKGLVSLQERIASRPDLSYDISQVNTTAQPYIGVKASSSVDPDEIGEAMGEAYGKVMTYVASNDIEMAGVPINIILSYDENGTEMICAIPTAEVLEIADERMISDNTYAGLAVKTIHKGDYALMEAAYNDLMAYMSYFSLEENGSPWEVYVTDPGSVPDTANWVTEIYFPVK